MKTAKIWITAFFLLITAGTINAQNFSYNQGDKMLNIGISPFTYGFGYIYYSSLYNNTATMTFPPLNANFQIGFHEFISGGVQIARFSRTYKSTYTYSGYTDEYTDKYAYTLAGVLAEFHVDNMLSALDITDLNLGEKIDLYVGVAAGLFISSWKSKDIWYSQEFDNNTNQWYWQKHETSAKGNSSSPYFRSYVGGRYMFTPKIGGFAELGYSALGYVNLGVTVKL